MNWYLVDNEQRLGPYKYNELHGLLKKKLISPESLIQKEGEDQSQKYKYVFITPPPIPFVETKQLEALQKREVSPYLGIRNFLAAGAFFFVAITAIYFLTTLELGKQDKSFGKIEKVSITKDGRYFVVSGIQHTAYTLSLSSTNEDNISLKQIYALATLEQVDEKIALGQIDFLSGLKLYPGIYKVQVMREGASINEQEILLTGGVYTQDKIHSELARIKQNKKKRNFTLLTEVEQHYETMAMMGKSLQAELKEVFNQKNIAPINMRIKKFEMAYKKNYGHLLTQLVFAHEKSFNQMSGKKNLDFGILKKHYHEIRSLQKLIGEISLKTLHDLESFNLWKRKPNRESLFAKLDRKFTNLLLEIKMKKKSLYIDDPVSEL